MDAAYFRQLARYNTWANERIYAAAAELSDAERKAKRPSFFGSIHATLNHILVGDRVWMSRLTAKPGGPLPSKPDEIRSLDQELYGNFNELRAARVKEDARIADAVGRYKDADLNRNLDYASMAGEERHTPLAQVLAHVFNHQTHHRGQVHGLLSHTRIAPPPLDMILMSWA
jgi:uncharacterized damage-inducible protein DinB